MTFSRGDVVRFMDTSPAPKFPGHTGLVMDVFDELGDDQNEHTVTVVWSTAGTIASTQVLHMNTARKFLEIVKTVSEAE
jgi:hypothetical protein